MILALVLGVEEGFAFGLGVMWEYVGSECGVTPGMVRTSGGWFVMIL